MQIDQCTYPAAAAGSLYYYTPFVSQIKMNVFLTLSENNGFTITFCASNEGIQSKRKEEYLGKFSVYLNEKKNTNTAFVYLKSDPGKAH